MIMKRILLSASLCFAITLGANAQFVKNDFLTGYSANENLEKGEYPSGAVQGTDPIMKNQWNLTGKSNDRSGVSPKTAAALTYQGYVESGKDVAIDLAKLESGNRSTIYSLGESGDELPAGTYYLSFLLNMNTVSSTSTNSTDFLAFDGNYTGTSQRARLTAMGIDENTYKMTLNGTSSTIPAGSANLKGSFNLGETYHIVIKGIIAGDGTGTCSLYVNPDLSQDEPVTALHTESITGTALKSIRGITIRQRTTVAGQISGIRFSDSWKGAVGEDGPNSIIDNSADKGNIVSSRYFDLRGVEVNEPVNTNSVYVKKDIYENGSVEVTKVIR